MGSKSKLQWERLKVTGQSSRQEALTEKTLYCVDFNQGRAQCPKEFSGSWICQTTSCSASHMSTGLQFPPEVGCLKKWVFSGQHLWSGVEVKYRYYFNREDFLALSVLQKIKKNKSRHSMHWWDSLSYSIAVHVAGTSFFVWSQT